MALFEVTNKNSRERDAEIINKSKVKAKPKRKNNIYDRMEETRRLVNSSLGKYKEEYYTIRDYDELDRYIAKSNEKGIISIDTETTGLDPILDNIVGICIYTPGEKPAYVPINHKDFITGERISNQLNEKQCGEIFRKLLPETKVIMFNATFDIRVLRNQIGAYLTCYWDCYVAARLMNENEPPGGNRLKVLHKKYVLKGQEDEFTFAELFDTDDEASNFASVPIDIAYLYGAHDAIVTYELYEWQSTILEPNSKRSGMPAVYRLFRDIEMPVLSAIADMEDNGITYSKEMQQKLIPEFSKVVEESKQAVYAEIAKYDKEVAEFKNSTIEVVSKKNGVEKKEQRLGYELLEDPINLDSPLQLAYVLYDIMKLSSPDPKSPRGTGEKDVLSKMDAPIAQYLIQYKKNQKLLRDFIIGLNKWVNPRDNKIHAKFNSLGADTGRFSSHDPNLQQVPAKGKGKKVRQIFKASLETQVIKIEDNKYSIKYTDEVKTNGEWTLISKVKVGDKITNELGKEDTVQKIDHEGNYYILTVDGNDNERSVKTQTPYLLLGSDFSAQEPRLTAQACGDPKMIQAYREGKDLYSEIASVSFKYPYVECLEHFPKDTPIKKCDDGNWRFATKEEIESKTYDKLADGEDVFYEGKGRRTQAKSILLGILYGRQSPSIAKQLGCTAEEATEIRESVYREFPKLKEFEKSTIEFAQKNGYVQTLWGRKRRLPAMKLPDYEFKWSKNHKPKVDLLDFSTNVKDEIPKQKIDYYTQLLKTSNWKEIDKIIKRALYDDEIVILSNTDKKARAIRQSVNSVIQGSAADMTKKALLEISRNKRLNELGFRILVTVHDEFIGECPRENAKECKELFAYCMNHCADDKLSIPVSCDVVVSELWEGDTVELD